MSEMVERVANMLIEITRPFGEGAIDYEAGARALIAAMRVPTEAMCSAPARADVTVYGVLPTGHEVETVWQAMIDAALKE